MPRIRPLLYALALVAALAPLDACRPNPLCTGRSLRIIEPNDGETVPAGEVNIVVEVCDFEQDEEIRLRLTEPVEVDYGFILVDDPDLRLYGLEVPTLPGTMVLYAEAVGDETTVSEPVSFEVAPEEP